MSESITLPKSGIVLTGVRDGLMWQADLPQSPGHFRLYGPVVGAPDWSATVGNYAVRGTREECLAHIDRVATQTLVALLPPGAIVVRADDQETRKVVARALVDARQSGDEVRFNRDADAVLAALKEAAADLAGLLADLRAALGVSRG